MIFCSQCGRQLPDNAKFCDNCGAPVARAPQQQVPQVPQPMAQPTPQPMQQAMPQPMQQPASGQQPTVGQQPASGRQPTVGQQPASGQQPTMGQQPMAQPMVQPMVQPMQQAAPQAVLQGVPQPYVFPQKQKKGKGGLIAVIVIAAVVVLAGVGVLLANTLFRGKTDSYEPIEEETVISEPVEAEEEPSYAEYVNNNAGFTLEYPAEYQLEEPDGNNVKITGDGIYFQAVGAYADPARGKCFVYSAEDLLELMEANGDVLSEWAGFESCAVGSIGKQEINGEAVDFMNITAELNGTQYEGQIYLFPSDGDYGCYVLRCVYASDSEKSYEYREQAEHIADSFRVTGVPEQPYDIYEVPEYDMRYCAGSENELDFNMSEWGEYYIYPEPGEFAYSYITFRRLYTEYPNGIDAAMGEATDFVLMTTYVINEGEIYPVKNGRYDMFEKDVSFEEDGKTFTEYNVVFEYNQMYWNAKLCCATDHFLKSWEVFGDFLASLQFTGPADAEFSYGIYDDDYVDPADDPELCKALIAALDEREKTAETDLFKPLAALVDYDGDGRYDLVSVYEEKKKDMWQVSYEVRTYEDGEFKITAGTKLFDEVGGNSGSVSVAYGPDGGIYLHKRFSSPTDEDVRETHEFIPWNDLGKTNENKLTVKGEWKYGKEESGKYSVNDSYAERGGYDSVLGDYMDLITLNLYDEVYDYGVMTFDEMRAIYGNY